LNWNYFKNFLNGTAEKTSLIKDDQVYQSLQSLNNKLDCVINMMIANSCAGQLNDRITEISASG
jgi:hypothetical protein